MKDDDLISISMWGGGGVEKLFHDIQFTVKSRIDKIDLNKEKKRMRNEGVGVGKRYF